MTDRTTKTDPGKFFEDFQLGQEILHAVPRTVTDGDVALYNALTGSRFALQSSDVFAMDNDFDAAPVDDLLVFHLVFGRTVPDVSLNAVANLGYAEGRFETPIDTGDTLFATSTVIGLKENSDGETGIVWVRTVGENQIKQVAVEFVRWVMVKKRDPASKAPQTVIPDLAEAVAPERLFIPEESDFTEYEFGVAGSPHTWEDYAVGEKIDHVDGATVEEAEHQMAVRLYQNTARVHVNRHRAEESRFSRRVVYGGHVISMARALSANGLANAVRIAAINAGRHVAPTFGGDTLYAWSEVLDKAELPGRVDLGGLRLRTVALKDREAAGFPYKDAEGRYDPAVVLDFDYWVLMPRNMR